MVGDSRLMITAVMFVPYSVLGLESAGYTYICSIYRCWRYIIKEK